MSRTKTSEFTDSDLVISEKAAPEFPEVVGNDLPATDCAGPMAGLHPNYLDFAEAVETATPKPTTGIVIFASVPVPKRKGRTAKLTYPINVLTASSDESFLVPTEPKDFKKVMTSIRTYGYRNGFKVVVREEDTEDGTGIRVWRKV